MHSQNVDTIKQDLLIIFSAPSSKTFGCLFRFFFLFILSEWTKIRVTRNCAWARKSQCQTWHASINNSGVSSFIYYLLFIWVLKCSFGISHTCVFRLVCTVVAVWKFWKEKSRRFVHIPHACIHIFRGNLRQISASAVVTWVVLALPVIPFTHHRRIQIVGIVKKNPLNYYAFNNPRTHSQVHQHPLGKFMVNLCY